MKMVFSPGSYEAPFHSVPPAMPGQNRTPCSRDNGVVTFNRVVVGC